MTAFVSYNIEIDVDFKLNYLGLSDVVRYKRMERKLMLLWQKQTVYFLRI